MSRCPSCFTPQSADVLCASCAASARADIVLPLRATLLDGRYQLGRTLGHPGGFGVTYLGWDHSLERLIAVKEFFPRHLARRVPASARVEPTFANTAEDFSAGLAGFLDEARRLAKFDHANIVKVHDFCEANGTGYLVMSYYEGHDVSARAGSPDLLLDWREAVQLVYPVLDGLAEVHRAGLIHRDIKPSNIYLAAAGEGRWRPVLIDFGAARWATTTHELTAILTEGFAPIEQYPGCGPQDARTDVYAVAATLYSVIAGRVPPNAPSRLAGARLPHLSDVVADVPRAVGDAIEHGLALQPDDRPQSADAFATLLRRAEAGRASTGESESATELFIAPTRRHVSPAPATGLRRPAKLLLGAAGLVAIAAALTYIPKWPWSTDPTSAAPAATLSDGPPDSAGAENGTKTQGAKSTPAPITFDLARTAMLDGKYDVAMRHLAAARAALPSNAAGSSARLRADSLAGEIARNCSNEKAILAARGVQLECPERPWH